MRGLGSRSGLLNLSIQIQVPQTSNFKLVARQLVENDPFRLRASFALFFALAALSLTHPYLTSRNTSKTYLDLTPLVLGLDLQPFLLCLAHASFLGLASA